jgi:hypothetical protein
VPRRITRRMGDPAPVRLAHRYWRQLAFTHYRCSSARDHREYPLRPFGPVTHESADVIVLWDRSGEVLNRYRLRLDSESSQREYTSDPVRAAFRHLIEL